jgi:hypothetical protein
LEAYDEGLEDDEAVELEGLDRYKIIYSEFSAG